MNSLNSVSTRSRSVTQSVGDALSDDERWAAVGRRDPAPGPPFFYAVKTTGIYCRPSCPSRRALRKNVAFFNSGTEAEAAGFRACQRCHPRGASLAEEHATLVAKACQLINANHEEVDLTTLASQVGLSPFYFQRVFKAVTGLTPKVYAQAHRANRVREILPHSRTVTDAIYAAGFNSNGRFYAGSSAMLGMKPARFRRGGAGEAIRFAVGECSLGSILVATSVTGICAIALGEDPEKLVRDIQDRFPHAQFAKNDRGFERWVAEVVGLIENPSLAFQLPLDLRGTVFQQRVWAALRGIPVGTTLSYTEVAQRVGLPKAVRAVASACGANTLAVAIPCHRVVRNDGALSGYRWGVDRKRALLLRERARRLTGSSS